MQPRIHFLILSIMILTTTVCNAQVGVVTNNLTLNDRVENFITNSNCDENELNELVRMIQKQGDLLQGLRVMNVAVKRFPDSYYAHYMRGFYNRNLENFEEAISDFSKAISIEPRSIIKSNFIQSDFRHLRYDTARRKTVNLFERSKRNG